MRKGQSAKGKKKGAKLRDLPAKRLTAAQKKGVKGGAIGRIEPRYPS